MAGGKDHHTWASRANKAEVRSWQLSVKGPRRRVIFFPGWDLKAGDGCLCVAEAMRSGVIGPDTELIAVERDDTLAPLIRSRLIKMGLDKRMTFHHGPLDTVALDGDIDFAFLDFTGGLDLQTCRWLQEELAPRLTRNATISFTFSYGNRVNPFMSRCVKAFQERFPKHSKWAYGHYDISDRAILKYLMILRSTFVNHQFESRRPIKYKDSVNPMVAYRLERFQKVDTPRNWPSLDDLNGGTRVSPASTNDPSRRKSMKIDLNNVQTTGLSQKNALEAKRLAARLQELLASAEPKGTLKKGLTPEDVERINVAVKKAVTQMTPIEKAWATRRAKAAAEKDKKDKLKTGSRSAAALKAWETRRGNESARSARA